MAPPGPLHTHCHGRSALPALFWRYLRKKKQSQAAGGTRSLCDALCVTTTGPVQRLEKHLLDGAGLRLKIDIVVKASARGRQVCGGGRLLALRSKRQAQAGARSCPGEKMPSQPRKWLLPPCISPRPSSGSWKAFCCRQGCSQLLKT